MLSRDENHFVTLLEYAMLANVRGKKAEAQQILLQLLVKDTSNKEVKERFTALLQVGVVGGREASG